MTALRQPAEDYLLIRRSLGFKLRSQESLLFSFAAYMDTVGGGTVTIEHTVRWATLPPSIKPVTASRRLSVVRGFARYLETVDPATQVPPTDLLGGTRWRRPAPYIYSPEEIAALMTAAGHLQTRLGAATMRTLIGLLASTGMRVGEALRLDHGDLDIGHARLVIRNSKFGKSRLLALHPSTITALDEYLEVRDRLRPIADPTALLIGTRGGRLSYDTARQIFRLLRRRVGLRPRPGSRPPRMADLRHTFAVNAMLDSYRNDGNPAQRLVRLSTYLGHVDPANTYWYLSAAPELLALAAARLEDDDLMEMNS
jgi:integrase/recombinase XerD